MAEQTAEERRDVLIERVAVTLMGEIGNDVRDWPPRLQDLHRNGKHGSFTERSAAVDLERRRMDAEAVLGLLAAEGRLIEPGDLQGSVAIVIDQLRVARADVATMVEAVSQSSAELGEAYVEGERLRDIIRAACAELDESWPETAAGFLREAGLTPP